MKTWDVSTLAEYASVQTGPFGSQLHAADYLPVGVPVVMPQDLGNNTISTKQIARVAVSDAERLGRYRLEPGDIVFSRRGDVTRRSLVREKNDGWLCGTGCLRVKPKPIADGPFLSYALSTPDSREWLVAHAVGATMPNLNTEILGRVPLRIPSLVEQRAIAGVLSALDDKIAANADLVDASRSSAVSYATTIAKRIPLSTLASLSKRSIQPATLGNTRVAHFSLPAFDASQLPAMEKAKNIQSQKFVLDSPVVLLSKLNPRFPRVWHVGDVPSERALASTEFLVLTPLEISTRLLWAALSQDEFSSLLDAKVAGTSGSHQRVKPGDALATPIADMRLLSDSAARIVTGLVELVDSLVKANRTLAALRDTLLPPLMSGKLRVRDAERAVSEVL